MKVERRGPQSFFALLESDFELALEERNIAAGGLLLRTPEVVPAFTQLTVTLQLFGAGEVELRATVVATPPGALALQFVGDPAGLLTSLRAPSTLPATPQAPQATPPTATAKSADGVPASSSGSQTEDTVSAESIGPTTLWDQLRGITPIQKQILATKADRPTRALLLQDSDPMVLFSLLKNPRLGVDEVVRIAKSSYLSFQTAELITKTSPWFANLDVRLALIHNPKLAIPMALRILPTLPENEVRNIAKGAATSQPLRQAALRKVGGG